MPRNLVIIPIEGVSQTLFWQYRQAMPTLWQMSRHSVSFRRFYSNSTSAFQSFCDFVHGDSSELDHNITFPSKKGCLLGIRSNLFQTLRENGHQVLGIQHSETRPAYLTEDVLGAWPEACGEFRWHGEYDPFYAEAFEFIERAKKADQPFTLYFSDRASTVGDNCPEKRNSTLFHERFFKGYSLLEQSVRAILEKLASLSLLDDTVVAVYGPYGMDPWKHGIYRGRVHATDPYADMCWTPMFLYNNNRDPKVIDNLASVIDMKETLISLVLNGKSQQHEKGPFSGINLLTAHRDVVFTQNLFALERENEGPAKGLMKSYAATDGDQRLIVSSGGGFADEGGMEFFYDPRDPANTRNLIDFFVLGEKGEMVSFGNANATHAHFQLAFHPENPDLLIKPIVNSYNAMRGTLKKLVASKEGIAFENCPNQSEARFFDEAMFNHKRNRR